MIDENIERDLRKEERTIWQEPQYWNYVRDGAFIIRTLDTVELMKTIVKRALDED